MNWNSSNPPPPPPPADGPGKKVRKPYTITKSRESWSEEEHDKFLEALQLFDRDWKKIEDFIGSKTVIQIRSHAQKYFLKVQKNGTTAHVPPPRPKRKAAHPYPQKAPKYVLVPLQASIAVNSLAPGYPPWDEASTLIYDPSSGTMPSQIEYNHCEVEEKEFRDHRQLFCTYYDMYVTDSADIGSKGTERISNSSTSGIGNSTRAQPSPELPERGKQGSIVHGIPDFAEVYSFIGSVFDPDSIGHEQKLKEMDPINFETVLLLMRNLTINLSAPDFQPIKQVLSSYNVNTKTVGVSKGNVVKAEE